MLQGLSITNQNRPDLSPLSLPTFGPSRFPIQFIDGLGPVKAEVSSSGYANLNEDHHQGSRVGARNIVLTLDLAPNYSTDEDPEQIRAELYHYMAPLQWIDMVFDTGAGDRRISGQVESFESPLFTREPAVQISILCFQPYFQSSSYVSFSGRTVNNAAFSVMNNGTEPVGFELDVSLLGTGTGVEVRTTSGIRFHRGVANGNSLEMDTRPRFKRAVLATADGEVNLLPYSDYDRVWPELSPGPNNLIVNRMGGAGNNDVEIRFRERYSGL